MTTTDRVARFRALHAACFVMPNPWDAGSARLLESLGFPALATTSAGLAFSRAAPDRIDAVPLAATLENVRDVVNATALPVNADFQAGFAAPRDLEALARNVAACAATGCAGLSIEDASGAAAAPLFEHALAVERVRVARAALDRAGGGVVLTARCEAFLVGAPDARRVVLERLVAYADAGADCLFAPSLPDLDVVAEVVRAVAPKPVNVIVAGARPGFTANRLADLGVRRISVGSALARLALGAVLTAARRIHDHGVFDDLAGAATFAELDAIFERP